MIEALRTLNIAHRASIQDGEVGSSERRTSRAHRSYYYMSLWILKPFFISPALFDGRFLHNYRVPCADLLHSQTRAYALKLLIYNDFCVYPLFTTPGGVLL